MGQTLTIGEAAALLGVHRNTVRNRIKAGRYNAHKVVTPQGETYVIERDSLELDLANTPDNESHAQVHDNPPNPSQAPDGRSALVDDGPQVQQLALVQSLLAPFIEQLGATKLELGRVTERLAAAEQERDELRRLMEAALLFDPPDEEEPDGDALFRGVEKPEKFPEPAQTHEDAPGRADPPDMSNESNEAAASARRGGIAGWWDRLMGR